MSLLKYRNGSNSLLRIRAIQGYLRVLANKKDNAQTTNGNVKNKMSVKFTVRGDEE